MSHKAKHKVPQLVIAGTAALASHTTQDRHRVHLWTGLVQEGSGTSSRGEDNFWADDLATNLACESESFSYARGDESVAALPAESAEAGIRVILKKVRNTNSDRPLQNWYQKVDKYLEENLRHEGRGAANTCGRCTGSCCIDATCQCPARECQGTPEWCCVDQECMGELMFCTQCILVMHTHHPTHFVELQELGLRVQLGHPPGVICQYRQATAHNFVLTLRLFQTLSCLGKLTAYDFLRGLEKCTNHDGLDKLPDRHKPFMHIIRQWHEVKRQKRAKRGHYASGVRGTQQGELVLAYTNWENAPAVYRRQLQSTTPTGRMHQQFIGCPTKVFRPRRPTLSWGLQTHIAKHVDEAEISNCSGFKAMFQANAKPPRDYGPWVSGVQCKMDFVLLSTLIAFRLLWLIISYDIACQYTINIWMRMSVIPERMQLKLALSNVWWKVLNFHLPDHHNDVIPPSLSIGCRAPGSRIEKLLSRTGLSPTGRRAQQDSWARDRVRLLAMYRVLPKRLAVAMIEAAAHKAMLDTFTKGLEDENPEQVKVWRALVDMWESKQHGAGVKSPFKGEEEVTTLHDIQLKIAKEELTRTETGNEVGREHTSGSFISLGLEIEDAQRKLTVDVSTIKDPTAMQTLAFTKRRTALLKRIQKFRQIQTWYMPALCNVLSEPQKRMYDGDGDQLVEATRDSTLVNTVSYGSYSRIYREFRPGNWLPTSFGV
ncbi:hypothetical protein K438DRAFT_1759468 [Mycena galopus ATCC 62051]|nr:hypothetical protein K438DRAFT_1759468 [Mycena galopus ATCC 62051]